MTADQNTQTPSKKESIELAFQCATELTIGKDRASNVINVATVRNTSFKDGLYSIRLTTSYNKAKKQSEYLTYKIEARVLDSEQITKLNTIINSKLVRERIKK